MKKESPFSMPGGGQVIAKSSGTPTPNKFAEPGDAQLVETSRPSVMPAEFAGETGFGGSK